MQVKKHTHKKTNFWFISKPSNFLKLLSISVSLRPLHIYKIKSKHFTIAFLSFLLAREMLETQNKNLLSA